MNLIGFYVIQWLRCVIYGRFYKCLLLSGSGLSRYVIFQAAVKAMDAISEWNVENDRPILDKWCVTGYDQYNLYNK